MLIYIDIYIYIYTLHINYFLGSNCPYTSNAKSALISSLKFKYTEFLSKSPDTHPQGLIYIINIRGIVKEKVKYLKDNISSLKKKVIN